MAIPTSAIRLVEAAVRARVIADSTFNTRCPGGLKSDEDDDNQTYPFTLFQNTIERPWNTMGGATSGHGREMILRMNIYSHYKGDVEVLLILERLIELLDFTTLTVSGYATVIVEFLTGKVMIEDRKKLEARHIPAEFLVRVHE